MVTLSEVLTQGLKRAVKVLDMVLLKNGAYIYVTTYHNGREDGFAVRGWNRMWVFAEDRRSDYMVLYTGDGSEFGLGNIPSEAVYAKKRMLQDEAELARVLSIELAQECDFIEAKVAQDKEAQRA